MSKKIKTNGRGRPSLGEPGTTSDKRYFRATDAEWAGWVQAASTAGARSTSQWIRATLDRAAKRQLRQVE